MLDVIFRHPVLLSSGWKTIWNCMGHVSGEHTFLVVPLWSISPSGGPREWWIVKGKSYTIGVSFFSFSLLFLFYFFFPIQYRVAEKWQVTNRIVWDNPMWTIRITHRVETYLMPMIKKQDSISTLHIGVFWPITLPHWKSFSIGNVDLISPV